MNEETKAESLLDGDFSCETTEDLYEPTDDELLYPSRHLDCRECNHPDKQLVEIRKDLDNWKLELIVCNHENRN